MKLIFFMILLVGRFSQANDKSMKLNLETAQKIASKALVCAKKNNWKLSVAIVNAEGNLLYFHRGDEAYVGSIETAIEKAKSANAYQQPTKNFADGIKNGKTGLVTLRNIVGVDGGMPIQFGETQVGAIGISGGKPTEDEQCAKSALE